MTAPGNTPDILSPEFMADPYSAYRVLRNEAPLLWHEGTQSYIISRYEDVERAFKDEVFTTANYDWQLEPVHGRTFLQMSGREHAVRRALVVTDPGVAATGHPQRIADRMAEHGIETRIYDGVHVEPTDKSLNQAIDHAQGVVEAAEPLRRRFRYRSSVPLGIAHVTGKENQAAASVAGTGLPIGHQRGGGTGRRRVPPPITDAHSATSSAI